MKEKVFGMVIRTDEEVEEGTAILLPKSSFLIRTESNLLARACIIKNLFNQN